MAAGRLKIDIRRKRILELLAQNGQVTVAELSGLLNATQTTIRTDLDTMAAENRLVRIPGGAIAIPAQPVQTPVQEAAPDALAAQKRAIAAKVLSHIQDGDTLFLNSGSTTLRVAEALCARKRLCVVTNSIRAAEVLAGYPETHVVLLGGEINAIYGFTFGDDAVQQLGRYQPAWAILSVDGVNAVQGITTYHAEEAMVNRIMIQQAHRAIIAADRRKVGRAGFTGICRLDDRFTVITGPNGGGKSTLAKLIKNLCSACALIAYYLPSCSLLKLINKFLRKSVLTECLKRFLCIYPHHLPVAGHCIFTIASLIKLKIISLRPVTWCSLLQVHKIRHSKLCKIRYCKCIPAL